MVPYQKPVGYYVYRPYDHPGQTWLGYLTATGNPDPFFAYELHPLTRTRGTGKTPAPFTWGLESNRRKLRPATLEEFKAHRVNPPPGYTNACVAPVPAYP